MEGKGWDGTAGEGREGKGEEGEKGRERTVHKKPPSKNPRSATALPSWILSVVINNAKIILGSPMPVCRTAKFTFEILSITIWRFQYGGFDLELWAWPGLSEVNVEIWRTCWTSVIDYYISLQESRANAGVSARQSRHLAINCEFGLISSDSNSLT